MNHYKTDLEIAHSIKLRSINEIAEQVGLSASDLIHYGEYKAKIKYDVMQSLLQDKSRPQGKLILVSAMTPTPMGEGKTTVSIGLTQGLQKIGKKSIVAIREPSLGPCFGVKGGAAGGGYAQVLPMEDINLHFTGDLHAVGTAHNLITAVLDNHLYYRLPRALSLRNIYWKRVMDMNDRSLRHIIIGIGKNGLTRESGFDITAASEIMAILCLSKSYAELKEKIGKILIGLDMEDMAPFFARDLKVEGAATALLKDALLPNLVQTAEHGPALIHGGPFANIAQGANTVLATKLGLKLADYTVTEAGFGSDLGAEKFLNIVSPYGEFAPSAMVMVATCRALKYHSGLPKSEISISNPSAIRLGSGNLIRHVQNARKFRLPVIVALNQFPQDSEEELLAVEEICREHNIPYSRTEVWRDGGNGALDLARKVVKTVEENHEPYKPLYSWSDKVENKIRTIAQEIYGAKDIFLLPTAKENLELIYKHHFDKLPICMAKTQNSFSDDPKLLGCPSHFMITIREIIVSSGAGFLVPITGEIMRMPGLPKTPAASVIDIDEKGNITGLF